MTDEFADGAETIARVLKQQVVKASFFCTGKFCVASPLVGVR